MTPVCGSRMSKGETERSSAATAPRGPPRWLRSSGTAPSRRSWTYGASNRNDLPPRLGGAGRQPRWCPLTTSTGAVIPSGGVPMPRQGRAWGASRPAAPPGRAFAAAHPVRHHRRLRRARSPDRRRASGPAPSPARARGSPTRFRRLPNRSVSSASRSHAAAVGRRRADQPGRPRRGTAPPATYRRAAAPRVRSARPRRPRRRGRETHIPALRVMVRCGMGSRTGNGRAGDRQAPAAGSRSTRSRAAQTSARERHTPCCCPTRSARTVIVAARPVELRVGRVLERDARVHPQVPVQLGDHAAAVGAAGPAAADRPRRVEQRVARPGGEERPDRERVTLADVERGAPRNVLRLPDVSAASPPATLAVSERVFVDPRPRDVRSLFPTGAGTESRKRWSVYRSLALPSVKLPGCRSAVIPYVPTSR